MRQMLHSYEVRRCSSDVRCFRPKRGIILQEAMTELVELVAAFPNIRMAHLRIHESAVVHLCGDTNPLLLTGDIHRAMEHGTLAVVGPYPTKAAPEQVGWERALAFHMRKVTTAQGEQFTHHLREMLAALRGLTSYMLRGDVVAARTAQQNTPPSS